MVGAGDTCQRDVWDLATTVNVAKSSDKVNDIQGKIKGMDLRRQTDLRTQTFIRRELEGVSQRG